MTEEIWRPVVGYEGLYEVSSYGRVRSLDKYVKYSNGRINLHKGRILSLWKDTNGYLMCNLYLNKNMKKVSIHRLVAQAFLPNIDNLPEVNHKDEDKTNNSVDNLEWCDRSYNNNYGTRKDKERESKLKSGFWTGLSSKDLGKREYNHQYYLKKKAGL